jgi:uncharacterized phiE125 gp8 family phage protein
VKYRVEEPPAKEPITLDEAKAHLRILTSDDDEYITALIETAREYCEEYTGRALITQTIEAFVDEAPPAAITLPKPPLQTVASVVFTAEDGTETTAPATDYHVDANGFYGVITLKSGKSWPSPTLLPSSGIKITYDAGYGDDETDVPRRIRQAMLLLIGHWYEHREEISIQNQAFQIPVAAKALLSFDKAVLV